MTEARRSLWWPGPRRAEPAVWPFEAAAAACGRAVSGPAPRPCQPPSTPSGSRSRPDRSPSAWLCSTSRAQVHPRHRAVLLTFHRVEPVLAHGSPHLPRGHSPSPRTKGNVRSCRIYPTDSRAARTSVPICCWEQNYAARRTADLTQEQLAAKARVDRTYISDIENDKVSPTVDMLERLCNALGIRVSALLAAPKKPRHPLTRGRARSDWHRLPGRSGQDEGAGLHVAAPAI